MKILVVSLGRFGKDTLCEIVKQKFGIEFISSSHYMLEKIVYPSLKDKYGYTSEEECYEDRVNHREEWFNLIDNYNKEDYSRLAKNILTENDIYCGMRCVKQFNASRHLFDIVIWVDAEKRLGITEDESSMTITKDMADIIIDNNGTLEDFENKVTKLFGVIFPERRSLEERKKIFGDQTSMYVEKYGRELCLTFYHYWTEHSERGFKMRFEKEKTFDMSRRLATFARNEKKFSIAGLIQSKRK